MPLPVIVPRSVLFGNPERTQPRLSPDGKRLAFVAPEEGVLNLWVGSLFEGDAEAVTHDRGRGISMYWWAYDSRHLLYMQDKDGDENWHIHSVDLETGEVVDRTPFPGAQATVVGMSSRVPHQVLLGINATDPRYHDVYRLYLESGSVEKIVENPGFDGWLVDRDLKVRGGKRARADGGADLEFLDDDGSTRVVQAVDPEDALINVTGELGFHADGRRIYARSMIGAATSRLVLFDPDTGDEEVLAEDPTYDVVAVSFHPETYEPQLVTFGKDRAEYLVLDPAIQGDIDALKAVHPGDLSIASRDQADATWIVAFNADDGPVSYYAWDRGAQKATFLFHNQPALAEYELGKMEPFSFTAGDGLTVHGYATFPPGVERQNLPCVLAVHGGPWGARHSWGYNSTAQWLANRGYVCLEINYRGSGGYGKDFLNASAREWAGKMHSDLIEGVDYAAAQGWIDRDRVAIFGGSYGGYAALVGATFTPDAFCCAVDIVGPSNLITLLESIPPYWVGVATQFHKLLGHPERDRDFLWERSPLSRVDQIKIPMLIGQGANDPRVKQAESEQIVAAMKERGIEHEYLLFEDEGHGFARPENREKFYSTAERFLAKHVGGRSQD